MKIEEKKIPNDFLIISVKQTYPQDTLNDHMGCQKCRLASYCGCHPYTPVTKKIVVGKLGGSQSNINHVLLGVETIPPPCCGGNL